MIIKEGNFFRTFSGLIGRVDRMINFNGEQIIEFNKNGKFFHIAKTEIKKCASELLDLLEYEDCLKVFNKETNGYYYYGISENNYNDLNDIKEGLLENNYIIVGIISKEYLKRDFFNTINTVCSQVEQDTCQKEKLGCSGCFYHIG